VTVVADAGPLIALARIDQVSLLPVLYEEIMVPPAGAHELTAELGRPGADLIGRASWQRVKPVDDPVAVQRLLYWLDQGESEAIALAQSLGATRLMDERRGCTIAASYGLSVTGTVGVLLAAKHCGRIDAVVPQLDALRAAGVYVSRRLYEEARRTAGEF
jgi:predicted nucleic acid-binding protein